MGVLGVYCQLMGAWWIVDFWWTNDVEIRSTYNLTSSLHEHWVYLSPTPIPVGTERCRAAVSATGKLVDAATLVRRSCERRSATEGQRTLRWKAGRFSALVRWDNRTSGVARSGPSPAPEEDLAQPRHREPERQTTRSRRSVVYLVCNNYKVLRPSGSTF